MIRKAVLGFLFLLVQQAHAEVPTLETAPALLGRTQAFSFYTDMSVTPAAISSNGQYVALVDSAEGRLVDLQSGEVRVEFDCGGDGPAYDGIYQENAVLELSDDGSVLMFGGACDEKTLDERLPLHIWRFDIGSGSVVSQFSFPEAISFFTQMGSLSSSGGTVASLSSTNILSAWDTETGDLIDQVDLSSYDVKSILATDQFVVAGVRTEVDGRNVGVPIVRYFGQDTILMGEPGIDQIRPPGQGSTDPGRISMYTGGEGSEVAIDEQARIIILSNQNFVLSAWNLDDLSFIATFGDLRELAKNEGGIAFFATIDAPNQTAAFWLANNSGDEGRTAVYRWNEDFSELSAAITHFRDPTNNGYPYFFDSILSNGELAFRSISCSASPCTTMEIEIYSAPFP